MLELLLLDLASWVVAAGIIAFLVKLAIIATLIFAVIGLITTIRFFATRKKKKKHDVGAEWLKTGRMPK